MFEHMTRFSPVFFWERFDAVDTPPRAATTTYCQWGEGQQDKYDFLKARYRRQ